MKAIASPCVSICALDADDICVGCYRNGDEINKWSEMSNEEKEQVMEKVKQRETKAYI